MRYLRISATVASAVVLATVPLSPAAAKPFEGDCTRTKSVLTCVHTYSEPATLVSTAFGDDCVDEQGQTGRLQTETYATITYEEHTTYERGKVVSGYTLFSYSDWYSVGPYCAPV